MVTKSTRKNAAGNDGEFTAVRPENKIYALGLATHFLTSAPGYADARLADGVRILQGLIERGHYFFTLKGDHVAGFAGWALTTKEQGEAWLNGDADLVHQDCVSGDSIVINVWHAQSPAAQKFMLAHIRESQAGKVMVYARRHYADGRIRPVRLALG